MWEKFREEDRGRSTSGITMADVISPMLSPSPMEATISECSLEVKGSDIFTPKLKQRLRWCCKFTFTKMLFSQKYITLLNKLKNCV